jgi:hypothetical protein
MNTNPEVVAFFKLDEEGKPVFETDRKGTRHYEITLGVRGAPEGTAGMTYELDDSYYEPSRDVWSAKAKEAGPGAGFAEPITSYGEFTVRAKAITASGPMKFKSSLTEALALGHRESMTAPIAAAISEISKY